MKHWKSTLKTLEGEKLNQLEHLITLAKQRRKGITLFDIETTDFRGRKNFGITEVGCLHILADGRVITSGSLIDPQCKISPTASKLTGIKQSDVDGLAAWDETWAAPFEYFAEHHLTMGYNSQAFDCFGVNDMQVKHGRDKLIFKDHVDVLKVVRKTDGGGKLGEISKQYGVIAEGDAHRATADALMTARLLNNVIEKHGVECLVLGNSLLAIKTAKTMKGNAKKDNKVQTSPGQSLDRSIVKQQRLRLICETIKEKGFTSIKELAKQLNLKEESTSFDITECIKKDLLSADQVVNQSVQEWLKEYLEPAIDRTWDGPSEGKLKLLLNDLNRMYNVPSELDYLQLKISLATRSNDRGISPVNP